jgi:hypothetical protein
VPDSSATAIGWTTSAGKQPAVRMAAASRSPRSSRMAMSGVARSNTGLPVACASESNASASGVPACSSVPSVRLQRAAASVRNKVPASGRRNAARPAASRASGERRSTMVPVAIATAPASMTGGP